MPMTELPTTFGKYYLTEKLATGGMAEIYLAKIIGPGGFEKPVVIKQILPKLSGQRHFVDLFVAEAKTLVTLAHGNIVPVYELGVIDETYFIAMDYIDGPTLYRLTETMSRREGLMEPAMAAWITARILDGLDYAHRKGEGVIHRDLSPRNVMLSRDGEVKLVDFGIAVTLGDPGEADGAQSAPTGSFPYMSPEQVRREPLNGQTDLFSVGVLLWEMLAGQRLFAKPAPDATLDAVLRETIPHPSSVRPEVPAKLDEVVMRALERDCERRWQSAGDMLAPLNKYLYSLDETPGPRDLATLVGRYCPPETRRLPTHLEALAHEALAPEPLSDGEPERDAAAVAAAAPELPVASGPRTAVIPRDGGARGKPQRQHSFATNVDLKVLLDRATPLLPFDAIDDTPTKEDKPRDVRDTEENEPIAPNGTPAEITGRPEEPQRKGPADVLREPPSRRVLVVAGIGAIALSAIAIYMFFRGRERVLGPHDAAVIATSSDASDDAPAPDDAGVIDVIATAATEDAGVDAPRDRDASVRRPDATITRPQRIDAGDVVPTGRATLEIGADPWGEIYIDGKPMGQTPKSLPVSAGRHTVEIVFPAVQPPRKQTFVVDLGAGETKPLHADFR
jgi:tRNA A-37 threonylcarbamoyl transferase component Bud32